MNASDHPLVRSRTPFDRRTQAMIASGKPRPVGGAFTTLPGGTSFQGGGGKPAATTLRPLHVRSNGSVVPGTIMGVMPTIDDQPLDADPPPTLSIPSSGTRYVIATITGVAEVELLDDRYFFHQLLRVIDPELPHIAVAISLSETAPLPADLEQTPADWDEVTFIVHLATFVDGRKTAQLFWGPVTGYIADAQNGTGKGQLDLTYPS